MKWMHVALLQFLCQDLAGSSAWEAGQHCERFLHTAMTQGSHGSRNPSASHSRMFRRNSGSFKSLKPGWQHARVTGLELSCKAGIQRHADVFAKRLLSGE
jgi:hypothetical protein